MIKVTVWELYKIIQIEVPEAVKIAFFSRRPVLIIRHIRPKKKISLFPMKRPGDFFSVLTRSAKK